MEGKRADEEHENYLRSIGELPPESDPRLAAQAPAMARLLLELQWEGGDVAGTPVCPSCAADKYPANDGKATHLADCELAAVLRAAGVMP